MHADGSLITTSSVSESAAPPPPVSRLRRSWDVTRKVTRRTTPFVGPALLAIAYLWLALHYIGAYRYQMNPDGVGYLSVARQYASGHFADAVNAYWSPLYSWLLVPLLLGGVEPLLATKVLGLLIGAATLYAMWRFATFARFPLNVKVLTCAAAIPIVVDAAYQVTTPDLLVGCAILYYLAGFTNPSRPTGWPAAVRIGLLAGVAYLAKAYALPFVLGHFLLVRSIELIRGDVPRRQVVGSIAITLLTLAVVGGAWSAALTHKFGAFMTGSTGRYNLRIDAPNSPGQVMHFAGFLPPVNDGAVSVWDDITYHVDLLPRWSPLESEANRQWLADNVVRNFDAAREQLQWFTPWCYPVLLAVGLVALSRADLRPRRPGLILSTAIVFYPCGYLLLHIERRFLVALAVLMVLAAGYVVSRAAARGLLSGWWRRALAAAAIGATFVGNPLDSLDASRKTGQSTVELARKFQGVLPAGATVASDDNWSPTLYLAFNLQWRYFGTPKPGQSTDAILADLDRLGVDYLLVWRNPRNWPTRSGWTEVPLPARAPFRIFKRPAPATTQPGPDRIS